MQARYEWVEKEKGDRSAVLKLSRELELPEIIAQVLVSRGISSKADARSFLTPEIKRDLGAPSDFPGVDAAVSRIWQAVQRGEHIVVFGDFDVDGVCAAVILDKALSAVGAENSVFLPLREPEGYGLTMPAIERCLNETPEKPGLLITVDCGIGSVHEVRYLKDQSIDVVITDHHECGEKLPEAVAVVNPHCGASAGAEYLCGAGVAFKVAHALVQHAQQNGVETDKGLAGQLVVAAGLATVADIVPLQGENRLFASSAMKLWKNFAGKGLHALLNRALTRPQETPDAYTFGFVLGPRINASGRMASAMVAYELLMTDDPDRARELAAELEGFNGERRGVQNRILKLAREQCGLDAGKFESPAVVVGGYGKSCGESDGWHPGVAGIVASQLCEETGCPAAVIVFDSDGGGRGSVRAGSQHHALETLSACSEVLDGFGGHAKAAGFQLRPRFFERFKKLFIDSCAAQVAGQKAATPLSFEAWLDPHQITYEMAGHIRKLAPFGLKNRMPRWALRDVTLENVRTMGASADHMQFVIKTVSEMSVRAVWFKSGDLTDDLKKGDCVDMVFELVQNDFRGCPEIELRIIDMRTKAASDSN
ncbi:MAG: single-stranded-DNA-specific exonuclease RecJ [Kiritimatiellia bacterium]